MPVFGCLHRYCPPCLAARPASGRAQPPIDAFAAARHGPSRVGGPVCDPAPVRPRRNPTGAGSAWRCAEQSGREIRQNAFAAEPQPERADPGRGSGAEIGKQPGDDREKQADIPGSPPDPAAGGPGVAVVPGTHAPGRRRKAVRLRPQPRSPRPAAARPAAPPP